MSVGLVIISFIVVLFILVSSHEMGHMVVAKRAGVKVEEFGIGIPPRLFAIKRGETVYSLNLIPLGAFVRTPGENDPTVPGSLASKGPWTRLGVYAAGPLVNVFLAFVFLSLFFMLPRDVVIGGGVMVHSVSEDSPAEASEIEPGDIVLRIDERQIDEWEDVKKAVNSNAGEEKTLLMQRGGERFEISLKPEFDPDLGRRAMGVALLHGRVWGMVTGVAEGSPADKADIRPGDCILSISGKTVYDEEGMLNALDSAEPGEEVELSLLRDGDEVLSAKLQPSSQDGSLGDGLHTEWLGHTETRRLPVWEAIYHGGDYLIHIPYLIKESIPIMREDPSKAVVGVVGAGQLTVEAVESSGFRNMALLAGIISVGLALFNFIPIPPLDGGGMLIGLVEGVRRGKRLSPRTVRLAYMAGTALIIGVFVMIMYNDIARLLEGRGFLQ